MGRLAPRGLLSKASAAAENLRRGTLSGAFDAENPIADVLSKHQALLLSECPFLWLREWRSPWLGADRDPDPSVMFNSKKFSSWCVLSDEYKSLAKTLCKESPSIRAQLS